MEAQESQDPTAKSLALWAIGIKIEPGSCVGKRAYMARIEACLSGHGYGMVLDERDITEMILDPSFFVNGDEVLARGGGGGGGGGHSGTEGGRTLVTYFAEEGVFFEDLRMSAIL